MPEIYAGIIFYNDTVPILRRAIESCRRVGIKICAVDGAFSSFPLDVSRKHYSTDGCLEYARDNSDIFIKAPASLCGWQDEWGGQCAKRNEYLKAIPNGSYVFILDADEEIIGSEIDKNLTSDVYNINLIEYRGDTLTGATPRIYKVYSDLHYKYMHRYLYRGGNVVNPDDPKSGLVKRTLDTPFLKDVKGNDIIVKHYPTERGYERLNQDTKFIKQRKERSIGLCEFPQRKVLVPPKDSKDYYDQWIKVQYIGCESYGGHLVRRVKTGDIFELPRFEYLRLVQEFGTINFREVKNG